METGRCSTRRIVVSGTLSGQYSLKHHYEATKGFLVTNPSMLLDIRTKMVVFILKLTMYVPTSRQISLRIYRLCNTRRANVQRQFLPSRSKLLQ
jgi:hypothetical protein